MDESKENFQLEKKESTLSITKDAIKDVERFIDTTSHIIRSVEDFDAIFDEAVDLLKKGEHYEAITRLVKCAENNHLDATCFLGLCYEKGNGVDQDYNAARELYIIAAEKENAAAQYNLGNLYFTGNGVERDEIIAVHWMERSANNGDSFSQYNVGKIYFNGYRKIQREKDKGLEFLSIAAENGSLKAALYLAEIYDKKDSNDYDLKKAFRWYRKAADLKSPYAIYCVANCYLEGEGVEKDIKSGIMWLLRAAPEDESGFSVAYHALGMCYKNGLGLPQSDADAFKFMMIGAKLNLATAQNEIGDSYRLGRGVKEDMQKAAFWYERSADQGHESAINNIGACYYFGQGVDKDLAKAYKWIKIAAEAGSASCKIQLQKMIGEMTHQQIAKGEELFLSHKSK
jgi:TPR repeat protein